MIQAVIEPLYIAVLCRVARLFECFGFFISLGFWVLQTYFLSTFQPSDYLGRATNSKPITKPITFPQPRFNLFFIIHFQQFVLLFRREIRYSKMLYINSAQ